VHQDFFLVLLISLILGGRPRGLGISSLFKPGYFQREVMGFALQRTELLKRWRGWR